MLEVTILICFKGGNWKRGWSSSKEIVKQTITKVFRGRQQEAIAPGTACSAEAFKAGHRSKQGCLTPEHFQVLESAEAFWVLLSVLALLE